MTEYSSRADACTQNTDKNNLHYLEPFKHSKIKSLSAQALISQIKQSHAANLLPDDEMNIISQFIAALVKAKSPTPTEGK